MRQNTKCSLYDDKDETINHTITECSKQAQKDYKRLGGGLKELEFG